MRIQNSVSSDNGETTTDPPHVSRPAAASSCYHGAAAAATDVNANYIDNNIVVPRSKVRPRPSGRRRCKTLCPSRPAVVELPSCRAAASLLLQAAAGVIPSSIFYGLTCDQRCGRRPLGRLQVVPPSRAGGRPSAATVVHPTAGPYLDICAICDDVIRPPPSGE